MSTSALLLAAFFSPICNNELHLSLRYEPTQRNKQSSRRRAPMHQHPLVSVRDSQITVMLTCSWCAWLHQQIAADSFCGCYCAARDRGINSTLQSWVSNLQRVQAVTASVYFGRHFKVERLNTVKGDQRYKLFNSCILTLRPRGWLGQQSSVRPSFLCHAAVSMCTRESRSCHCVRITHTH